MKIRGIIPMGLLMVSSSLMLLGGPSISTAKAAAYTCAQGGTCVVGNVGPGGGRVFYAPGTAFTMTGAPCSTTCRYLESAPLTGAYAIDNVTRYGLLGQVLHPAALQTSAIGSGYSNTAALVAATSTPTAAGNVAKAYRGSANLSDWFLPSSLEISAYWASSPTDATTYYMASNRLNDAIVIVNSGGDYYDFYNNTRPVLPIRAFAPASAPSISLSQTTLSAVAGTAVTSYAITSSGGAVGDYSISPNIAVTPSNGISFSTTTGLISGTPTAAASSVTYTVTATNGGGSTTATFSITVSSGTQTITFPDLSPITLGGAAPTATATASSNLTVAFTSATTAVCTVTGTTITVLTTGTCTINANQSGNGTYAAAAQVQKSFVISPVPVVDDGAALAAAAAAAAKRAAEQKELTELLALIPEIAKLSLELGETTKSLYQQKCVKGKHVKYVKNGAKCPKGYVIYKKKKVMGS
jgi:large repetitive protein